MAKTGNGRNPRRITEGSILTNLQEPRIKSARTDLRLKANAVLSIQTYGDGKGRQQKKGKGWRRGRSLLQKKKKRKKRNLRTRKSQELVWGDLWTMRR